MIEKPAAAPAAAPAVSDDKLWDQAKKDRAATSDASVEQPTPSGAAATPAPAKKEPAAPAPAAAAPQPVSATPSDDPLSGLPEPTRKLIEGLQANDAARAAEQQKLRRELDTAHGTIGSLKQDLQKNREQLQPTVDAVTAASKAADAEKLATERKRVEAARAKLADLLDPEELDLLLPLPKEKPAEPVSAQAPAPAPAAPAAPAAAAPAPAPQPAPSAPAAGPAPEVVTALHEAMELVHPGWRQTRESPEFKTWFNTAPDEVKALSKSWSAADTAKIFDAYKKHTKDAAEVARLEADRNERLRRGEGPQGKGSAAPGAPASDDALWERAKRDRAAQQQATA